MLFVFATRSPADQPSTYDLSFSDLHFSSGERVSKFDLNVRPAMIIGFRNIPVGWRISIDNDPSWITKVSGIAVVGAADLEEQALQPWFLSLLPEPGDKSGQSQAITINGSITLAKGDQIRTVEITNRDVTLVPSRRP